MAWGNVHKVPDTSFIFNGNFTDSHAWPSDQESMPRFLTCVFAFRIFLQSAAVSLAYISFAFNPSLLGCLLKDSWIPSSIRLYYFLIIFWLHQQHTFTKYLLLCGKYIEGMAEELTAHVETNKSLEIKMN